MEYSVGQVLYALSNKEMAVIPLRITEKILRQTLDGEVVSYVAETAGGRQVEDLTRLSATFYTSSEDVRGALIDNVTHVVGQIVDGASQTATKAFGQAPEKISSDVVTTKTTTSNISSPSLTDAQSVTLPDGTVAKLKLPDSLTG
jgi:hypothetical protein